MAAEGVMNRLFAYRLLALGLIYSCVPASAEPSGAVVRTGNNSLLKTVGAEKDQYIDIRGSWVQAAEYESPRIPTQNATAISCGRASSECIESQATVKQIGTGAPLLTALTIHYSIESWDEDAVVAKRVNPRGVHINCTLRIAPSQGLATLECVENPDDNHFRPAKQTYTTTAEHPFNIPSQWPVLPRPAEK